MKLTVFHIKILAMLFMLIDHIGYVFFPQAFVFRMIGRLAFPLFAWLIANGAIHTHNMKRYLLRIFLLAVISQIPYVLMVHEVNPNYWDLNAIFSLFLGLFAIACFSITKNKLLRVLIVCIAVATAVICNVDYGGVGVLSIIFFYLFFHDLKKMALSQFLVYVIRSVLDIELYLVSNQLEKINITNVAEPVALLSLVFIALYNGKEGLKMQWAFYAFYPLHLLVLYLLRLIA